MALMNAVDLAPLSVRTEPSIRKPGNRRGCFAARMNNAFRNVLVIKMRDLFANLGPRSPAFSEF